MDILASIFAYVAGIGALFAGLVFSFFVFFSTPIQSPQTQAEPQTQTQPQSASVLLVRPSPSNKAAAAEATAKPVAVLSEKQAAASSPDAAPKFSRHKASASAARLRRLVQEERARRWAYQQDSSFESRFLGYAD
jgi:hypothetical protein